MLLPVEEEPDTKKAATGQGATPVAAVATLNTALSRGQPPQGTAYAPQYAVPA